MGIVIEVLFETPGLSVFQVVTKSFGLNIDAAFRVTLFFEIVTSVIGCVKYQSLLISASFLLVQFVLSNTL